VGDQYRSIVGKFATSSQSLVSRARGSRGRTVARFNCDGSKNVVIRDKGERVIVCDAGFSLANDIVVQISVKLSGCAESSLESVPLY
jgi:hypothetical protein